MRKFKKRGFMISNRINITEEGEVYDRKEIALAIRNSTYNDELKCSPYGSKYN